MGNIYFNSFQILYYGHAHVYPCTQYTKVKILHHDIPEIQERAMCKKNV